jgi:D-amino-acid dehydrogenase
VDLRWSTEARGWRHANGRVEALITDAGEVRADDFVLACGSWSRRVARGLGLKLPLQAGKGYNVTLPSPRIRLGMSAILTEARVGVTPMGDSLRFAGTLELAGLDTSIDQRRVQAIIDSVPNYYPEFSAEDFANVAPWSGLRPCTPDGLPYIGRTRRYENLVIATGHAMMGLSLGPATGMVVSDVLARREPSAPIERFDPDRFS